MARRGSVSSPQPVTSLLRPSEWWPWGPLQPWNLWRPPSRMASSTSNTSSSARWGPAARQLPKTIGGPLSQPQIAHPDLENGDGIGSGGSNPGVGVRQNLVLSLRGWAEPKWALARPCPIYRWGSQETGGSKNPHLGAGQMWEAS